MTDDYFRLTTAVPERPFTSFAREALPGINPDGP